VLQVVVSSPHLQVFLTLAKSTSRPASYNPSYFCLSQPIAHLFFWAPGDYIAIFLLFYSAIDIYTKANDLERKSNPPQHPLLKPLFCPALSPTATTAHFSSSQRCSKTTQMCVHLFFFLLGSHISGTLIHPLFFSFHVP
jgi:hypothetical protein